MLSRRCLASFVAAVAAFATAGCSDLTRPNEISIKAEPAPVAAKANPAPPPVPTPAAAPPKERVPASGGG